MTERQERAVDWQQGESGSYAGTTAIELGAQHVLFLNRQDGSRQLRAPSELATMYPEGEYSRYTTSPSRIYSYDGNERFLLRPLVLDMELAEPVPPATPATSSESIDYTLRLMPSGRPTESTAGNDSGSLRSADSPELHLTPSCAAADLMSVHSFWSTPRAMQHSSALAGPYDSLDIFSRHVERPPLEHPNTSQLGEPSSSNVSTAERNSTIFMEDFEMPRDSLLQPEILPEDSLVLTPTGMGYTTGIGEWIDTDASYARKEVVSRAHSPVPGVNNSNRDGLSRGTPNPSRSFRDSPINSHEDRYSVDRSEQPVIVRVPRRRGRQISWSRVDEQTALSQEGAPLTSDTYEVLLSDSSGFDNQGQHSNTLAPQDTSSTPATGGPSANAGNFTASGVSNPEPRGSSGQSQGPRPPNQGTANAANQTGARAPPPSPPTPPSAAALIVGFLKADPAIMTAFQFLLLAGLLFQAWSLFEFFNREPIKGQNHFRDPEYFKLLASFCIQLAFLFILASDLKKHKDPFVRLWIIVFATLCLLSSGSGLIAYFWYTALGDALMWLGTLFQTLIWQMTVFRRRRNGDEFSPMPASLIGSPNGPPIPLANRRPVSTAALGA